MKFVVDFKEYKNGNLAVLLYDEFELPVGEGLSVETEVLLDQNEFVVNRNLNKNLLSALINANLFEDTGKFICSHMPIWRRKAGK